MDNFEIDKKAKELEDALTPYALARRVVELAEYNKKLESKVNELEIHNVYLEKALEEAINGN